MYELVATIHVLQIYLLQIHVLQIHVLQIYLLQINLLQIHLLQIQSMFYKSNPVYLLQYSQELMSWRRYIEGPEGVK